MKYIINTLILFLVFQSAALAQEPQPIYSFAKVLQTVEWYKEQQKLWKAEIDKNSSNAQAWYYYFKASRVLTYHDKDDKRSGEEKGKFLKKIVEDMSAAVPNSFEYNHAAWIVTGLGDFTKITYLQKAAEIQPDNVMLCPDMMNWGEISRDTEKRDTYARLSFTSGDASPGILNYNYNVMAGLKENAILVTVGDNDTYPIWILQATMGFRKDITVINTSLILIKEYRDKLFKELGVPAITYDPFESEETRKKFTTEILSVLAANKTQKPVYLALTGSPTCDGKLLADNAANLYLTGLAYEYSATSIDNIALLKKNFEHNYALDYLDKQFAYDVSSGFVKRLNINYIVPMVKLHEHYILAGETQKAELLKNRILIAASGTDEEAGVKEYFKK